MDETQADGCGEAERTVSRNGGGAPCQASALHTYRGKGNAAASSLVWMTTSFWVGLVMAT